MAVFTALLRLALANVFFVKCSCMLVHGGSRFPRAGIIPQRCGIHHQQQRSSRSRSCTGLHMGLDMVTYLRTEWISAALCTNQTPRAADVCLQLGTEDGRAVTFVPRTIRKLITSSAQPDGTLAVSAQRQLKQQAERRGSGILILTADQRADDLTETDDESVDVVISLQAAQRMQDNGLDWKKSVKESARVLKPGGRLLFVEQTEINGDSYLSYVQNLCVAARPSEDETDPELFPIFDDVGFDEVNLVLVPHTAGVAIKSVDAGLTVAEREAKIIKESRDQQAELSISAFERGNKKRRKKKKIAEAKEGEN